MKKFSIVAIIVIVFLSTFNYHLGKIPAVNMYANHYIFHYFDETLDLEKTSSPLASRTLILLGAKVNHNPSSQNRRKYSSPLWAHIEAYNKCSTSIPEHEKDKRSVCEENHLEIISILLDKGADSKGALFQTKHVPILKLLLKFGADIEEKNREGMTPLFYQTKYMTRYNTYHRNDLDSGAFEFLVSQGADIHVKDTKEQTLLHVSKHSEIIEFLLKKGLDINAKDKVGNTPLFYRAEDLDEPKPLKTLVENGADIDIKNLKGQTALAYVLQSKNYPNKINKNAAYLLKKGALLNDEIYVNALYMTKPTKLPDISMQQKMWAMYEDINKDDEYSIPAAIHKMELNKSALNADPWKSMEYLINFDFVKKMIIAYDKNTSHVHNDLGDTPLHYVVRYSDELTDYFIAHGVDVNSLNHQGQTPLFFAENTTIAQKLIDHGASLYIKDKEGKGALDYIKEPELLNYLLAKGVDVKQHDNKQRTPFINYIQKNASLGFSTAADGLKYDKHYGVIKAFLNNGADINERIPENNETILFYVNDTKLLNQLLEDGIDKEAKNKMGQTALFKFMRFPVVEMGKTLIKKGANIDVIDNEQNTLLHFVLDEDLALILLEKGLDVNSKNRLGDTPLHTLLKQDTMFSRESKYKTFELFLQKGADVNSQNNKGQTPLMIAKQHKNTFYINGLLK